MRGGKYYFLKPIHNVLFRLFGVVFFSTLSVVCPARAAEQASVSDTQQPSGNSQELRSLMFSDSDIEAARKARLFFERSQSGKNVEGGEDFLKKLEKLSSAKEQATSFTYPQFFLSSIAYYSDKDWVIWVNGEKITQDMKEGVSLRVLSVSERNVQFEWMPERPDKVADVNDYSENSLIKVDSLRNKVIFTLMPNQTFSSYAMKIVEGVVAPVTIDSNGGNIEKGGN